MRSQKRGKRAIDTAEVEIGKTGGSTGASGKGVMGGKLRKAWRHRDGEVEGGRSEPIN